VSASDGLEREHDVRVPKIPGQVKIELRDGTWLTGSVFLSPLTELHHGPEQIHDLLRGEDDYIPIRLESGGAIRMVPRSAMLQIRLERKAGERELDPAGILDKVGKFHRVRVGLRTGETLDGEFPVLPDHAHDIRVLDWLNLKIGFVPLVTPEMMIYIAHRAIMWVEENPAP
jgi:hypothetical protein